MKKAIFANIVLAVFGLFLWSQQVYGLDKVVVIPLGSNSNSIVGCWWPGSNSTEVGGIVNIVFFNNGTYLHVQNGDDNNSSWDGYEYGTYSYDTATKILSITPVIDQNGEVGFSNLEGQVTVTVNRNSMTLSVDGDPDGTSTFYRVK